MLTIGCFILSYDNNSDLAPFINDSYDKVSKVLPTKIISESIDVFENRCVDLINSPSFKNRLVESLKKDNNEYILLLLDDYYVTDDLEKSLGEYSSYLRETKCDYLRVFKEHLKTRKLKRAHDSLYLIEKPEGYNINFHPSFWRRDTLLTLLQSIESDNIRDIEAHFCTYFLENNKKAYAIKKNYFPYVELVVNGLFFRKPFKKYCLSKYSGSRKKCSIFFELKFKLKHFISLRFNRKLLSVLKKKVYKNKEFYTE